MSIADEQRNFYQRLYREHGDDPRALSHRDEATQQERFARTARLFEADDERFSVHEVGFGLGHFGHWLQQHRPQADYSGSEVCPEFVECCRQRFGHDRFQLRDLSRGAPAERYDWLVLLGTFNIRLERNDVEWFDFIRAMLTNMYSSARKGISVDFLTTYCDAEFTRPDLYYQDEKQLLDFVHERLSRHVELDKSGPLYEYSFRIYRPEYVRARHPGAEFDRYFPGTR